MSAIRVQGLEKSFMVKKKAPGLKGSIRAMVHPHYEKKQAVLPLDFSVEQGETLAFLGPNGAGKSTTIKMLTGIMHPSRGEAEVLGLAPWKERKKLAYRIGTVFGQKSQLWYHLPPSDTFELMAQIYEVPRQDFLTRKKQLIRQFDLEPYLNTPVRKLSLGERMRCEIAAALLHRPQIIFLDEPTIGLDVIVKQKIRNFINEINRQEGVTVFLTSHDAGDIEQLCRRAIVINHGRIIFNNHVQQMKQYLKYKILKVKLTQPLSQFELTGVAAERLNENEVRLKIDISQQSIEQVLTLLLQQAQIEDITIEDPTLEQVITSIYVQQPGTLSAQGSEKRALAGKQEGVQEHEADYP